MTKDQQDQTDGIAKRYALHDANERIGDIPQARVCDTCDALGIVDAKGMIDVNGEIARRFKMVYVREYRAEMGKIPAGVG